MERRGLEYSHGPDPVVATGKPQTYVDYSGGVNAQAASYLLVENQAKDARNVHTTPQGTFRKRNGFTDLVSDTGISSKLDSLHSLFAVNLATKSFLVAGKTASASSDRIIKIVGTTCTTLKSSLTQNKKWSWVQAPTSSTQGPIYGVNGTDTPQQWDGAAATTSDWTASTGTVPATAKYLNFHTDRIWATGTTDQGRVQYSGLTATTIPGPDPRNWDADGYVELEPDDGEDITGIGSIGPYQLVTKARKCYAITDPASAANKKISDEIGCIAHRSIVETTEGTFFLSEDVGVCVTDGSTVKQLDDRIIPFLRTAASNNPTLMPFCAAFYFQHSYFLSIPYTAAANDLMLEYDLQTKSWWVHSIGSNQFAIIDPAGTPKAYSANPSSPTVQRAFTPASFQDSGSTFTAYFTGPYLAFGDPHIVKRIHEIRVDAVGGLTLSAAEQFSDTYNAIDGAAWEPGAGDTSGTFGADDDLGATDTFAGSGTWGPTSAGTSEWRFPTPLDGMGRSWSLKYSNAANEDFEVQSTTAFVNQRAD